MKENETFRYTYSAREQEEIRAIRRKYAAAEPPVDRLAELRRIDAAVTQKAAAVSLVFGVIGALLLGTGMSLIMTELGAMLGLAGGTAMLASRLIGIPGILLVAAAYPIYNRILAREREKRAPEILRLTDELMK